MDEYINQIRKDYTPKIRKLILTMFLISMGVSSLLMAIYFIFNMPFIVFLLSLITPFIPITYYTVKITKLNKTLLQKEREYYQQKLKVEQLNPIITCKICKKQISINANACPHCGELMTKRCPKCHSADIKRVQGALYDIIQNSYHCKACGEKFK